MPIYEYSCKKCDHRFEELIFAGDPEPKACPACASSKVQRGFSIPASPQAKASLPVGGGCMSSGPPCGPACSRY